ncbi:MAG: argininosuccinate lyase [Oscillospiraceae bacterium]|jgi:argininosuccinate lyase|nr:argininosuccinate lyase [Oscillospiraceae bacterium]
MRERLNSALSESICQYISGPAIAADHLRSFYNMADSNMAHVLMLQKQKIIDQESAVILLRTLWDLYCQGPSCLTLDPKREDYYFNVESYVISKAGREIGGKLHTARSRNDLGAALSRMNTRDKVVQLLDMTIALQSAILLRGEDLTDQVVTGYTHMQPAQPISLGFYLSAVAAALDRDIERLQDAYTRLNYSSLGACAFAGTSFPIDRAGVAEDLGFYGPVINCLDAVAARDYMQEIAADLTILGTNLNRFVTDLYFWSTDEFGYIEIDDSLSAVSSIMPQKKNPISLEHVRAKTAHLLASFVSITTALKGIPYGHNRECGVESGYLFWDACAQMEAILVVLREIVVTSSFKCDKMEKNVDANFCTVTELADILVKKEGIPFRTAHEIVSYTVRSCIKDGHTAADFSPTILDKAAVLLAGRHLHWSEEELRQVLSAKDSVRGKTCYGGPSPSTCGEMLAKQMKDNRRARSWLDDQTAALAQARERLHGQVREALV